MLTQPTGLSSNPRQSRPTGTSRPNDDGRTEGPGSPERLLVSAVIAARAATTSFTLSSKNRRGRLRLSASASRNRASAITHAGVQGMLSSSARLGTWQTQLGRRRPHAAHAGRSTGRADAETTADTSPPQNSPDLHWPLSSRRAASQEERARPSPQMAQGAHEQAAQQEGHQGHGRQRHRLDCGGPRLPPQSFSVATPRQGHRAPTAQTTTGLTDERPQNQTTRDQGNSTPAKPRGHLQGRKTGREGLGSTSYRQRWF